MKKMGESLKEDQIAKLLLFIRSLSRAPAGDTWKPYLAGDPKVGRQIFFDAKNKVQCVKCHTIDSEGGRVGPALDHLAGRRSPDSLFDANLSTFEDDRGAYNQKDAEGFIRLNGLRLRTGAKRDKR